MQCKTVKNITYLHLDGDVPRATSYGVYISQLIRFARPVLSLRISVIAIVLSLKSSSHKDIGMTNFVKLSLNSIIGISLSLASIKVI